MKAPYVTRIIALDSQRALDTVLCLVQQLPIAAGLEVVIRIAKKLRKQSQNDAMWAGPLADIAAQAWTEKRQYSAKVWHHYFKEQFLPDQFDAELCKDGYQKWDYTPAGERMLVGSTTQLTRKGFALYLMEVEAAGANMGVLYSASPSQVERAQ